MAKQELDRAEAYQRLIRRSTITHRRLCERSTQAYQRLIRRSTITGLSKW